MRTEHTLWPGPVCTQPECALKRHDLNQDGLAELIVEAISVNRPIEQSNSSQRIRPHDVCKDCALRVLRGKGALLTRSEKEELILAGHWSARRLRRLER
jgi:hypothetical protein